jgi:phage antirepressor YoqD-like protein
VGSGMTNDLDLFANAGDGLEPEHFGIDDHGRAYVVASVFAKAMGYRDASNALRILDDAEKGTHLVSTLGGDQLANVIYEDGIWELIFRSTLPSAKSIKARVKEILRQLRETGLVDVRVPSQPEKPMTELEMARKYVAALERVSALEPKAEAHDAFLSAEGDYLVGTVAKMLGIGPNVLFRRLRDEHILIKGGRRHNTPYQQYAHHFRVVARTIEVDEGADRTSFTTYVKPSGVDFIRKVLKMPAVTP